MSEKRQNKREDWWVGGYPEYGGAVELRGTYQVNKAAGLLSIGEGGGPIALSM
jgi:hypothetical protein